MAEISPQEKTGGKVTGCDPFPFSEGSEINYSQKSVFLSKNHMKKYIKKFT